MITVAVILREKGSSVQVASPELPVVKALQIMADNNVGALVVVKGDEVVGIFSERDYARKLVLKGRSHEDTTVQEIMTPAVITVRPDQSIDDCMEIMTNKRIRHLPVVDGHKLAGIISIGDVVKAIIAEKEVVIKHLENYITGAR